MTNVEKLIPEILNDFLDENGLELWSCEYKKEGKDYFLRVYIDTSDAEIDNTLLLEDGEWSESYVSTEDCELVSEYLSKRLDELDPISENYYLEVSSPGMDRELVTESHFKKCMGQMIDVELKKAVDEKITWQGRLTEYGSGMIKVEAVIDTKAKNRKPGAKISPKALEKRVLEIPLSDIKSARLAVIW